MPWSCSCTARVFSHTASGSRQTFLRLAYGDCLLGYTRSTYSASGLISYHTPTTHHSVSPPSPPHIVGRHSPTRVSLTLVQRLLCVRSCPLSHIYPCLSRIAIAAATMAVDWPGGRETKEYLGHKKKVHSLAWNCSGEKLASGSVDQSVSFAQWSFSPTAPSFGWPRGSLVSPHPTQPPFALLTTPPATSAAGRCACGPSTPQAARQARSSRATRTPWTSCGGTRSNPRCWELPQAIRLCAYGTHAPESAPTRSRPRVRRTSNPKS